MRGAINNVDGHLVEVAWLTVQSAEQRNQVERFALAVVLCRELGHRPVVVDRGFPVTLFICCARCEVLLRRCTPEEERWVLEELTDQLPPSGAIEFDATFTADRADHSYVDAVDPGGPGESFAEPWDRCTCGLRRDQHDK